MLRGNRGEWSEIYAFLRLLADGKIFAADADINKIELMFFPILNIIREEVKGKRYEYCLAETAVNIYRNDDLILSLSSEQFHSEAVELLERIKASTSAFGSVETEAFMNSIYVNKLKAPSTDKSDINIGLHDIFTGYKQVVGFSIKSELGSPPTLLNAGHTTNFIYKVCGLQPSSVEMINAIATKSKIKDRITAIRKIGGTLEYFDMYSPVFEENLIMIDSRMPIIVATMVSGYYRGVSSTCEALTNYAVEVNPLGLNAEFYKHKVKELLCAVALGMVPGTKWTGFDEASGGYIIVKTNGDVLAYHIYNRDAFKEYLLKNTRFDTPSSSRHGFGVIEEQNGQIFMKLNLQIRFI